MHNAGPGSRLQLSGCAPFMQPSARRRKWKRPQLPGQGVSLITTLTQDKQMLAVLDQVSSNAAVIQAILGAPPKVAVYVAAKHTGDGRKRASPTAIRDTADLDDLIEAHLAGTGIPPRECVRQDGTGWLERNAFAIGAYPFGHDDDGHCRWCALDLDGSNHAGGNDDDVIAAAHAAVDLLEGEGIPSLAVRSHSGHGAHIWIIFEHPQPGAFAHWLGELIATEVRKRVPKAMVESFPKQEKAALGNPLALPFAGAVADHGGGVLLSESQRHVAPVTDATLAPLLAAWKRWAAEKVKAEKLRREQRPIATVDHDDAVNQCRQHLTSLKPAVTGQKGDVRTLVAAMAGGDFGLSKDDFLPLFKEWNERCDPPWSDRELSRKLKSAYACRKNPVGCLLEVNRG